ncbi:MAG TPA: FAD-linked oxidase C-terminal domain-containing protein, partial [Polyangiaceae bacterium]|nr:FAD-linked oxidase C-terminal domain-containing protein [Polyangiaceae bacterium]
QLLDAERGAQGCSSGYTIATAGPDIAALWNLRKKGVGLLGNAKGERRPVPFVEDTAVPPEHLADYIAEFRALLDRRGLRYGMFGHVDVGCLHVRPALDMKEASDEQLLRGISDEVVALTKKYGGVLWGEHGRGYRSEYTPTFFGPELYEELRAVKSVFDPHNQLNPGKLATPSKSTDRLVSLDATKRGSFDRQIHSQVREKFAESVHCNGNGACFDYNPDAVMCPSSKVTKERIHSPKGRAGILREWLRLMSQEGHMAGADNIPAEQALVRGRSSDPGDFSHQVYDAMNGCLACKACATQCPIKVDIPHMRSAFYEQYHSRYRRPIKDYFVAGIEGMIRWFALGPRLFNFLMQLIVVKWVVARVVGIVDSPDLAVHTLRRGLKERGAERFEYQRLAALDDQEKARTVLLVQDMFTSYYEPNVVLAAYDLLTRLGLRVILLPYRENGKALHIKGFLRRFARVVERNTGYLEGLAQLGIPLVGVEPATTLTYRDEYRHQLDRALGFKVQLLQEYLSEQLAARTGPVIERRKTYRLFGHCTERTFEPKSQQLWQTVFSQLGAELKLETTGCCGMCGVFGHEAEHLAESRGIFEMSWKPKLPQG